MDLSFAQKEETANDREGFGRSSHRVARRLHCSLRGFFQFFYIKSFIIILL